MTVKYVTIYTDGACAGNPGVGGFGVVMLYGEKRREIAAGFRKTTNNRMEIMAAIAGLESLKYPCVVTIYSDSQYLCNSMIKGWAKRWRAKDWIKGNGEPAMNTDLFGQLLDLCEHEINDGYEVEVGVVVKPLPLF